MLNYLKKILGIDKLEYKIRLLERKNYWREKYKHVISERKSTTNILQNYRYQAPIYVHTYVLEVFQNVQHPKY